VGDFKPMKRHYHVMAGLHGCLPDQNAKAETLTEAKAILREMIISLKEMGDKYYGSVSGGWFEAKTGNYYVGIEPCELTTCVDDSDNY